MGIAGSVLFCAKGLRRELFRASTVAPNMVEIKLVSLKAFSEIVLEID